MNRNTPLFRHYLEQRWPGLRMRASVAHANALRHVSSPVVPNIPRREDARLSPASPITDGSRHMVRWTDTPEHFGLRLVGKSHDVCRSIGHTGWFLDPDGCGESAWGVVYRLPRGRGFVAGVADSHGGHIGLALCGEPEGTEEEAARYGDQLAEWYAEAEREYQTAWRAGCDAGEARTEAETARAALLALLREMRPLRRAGGIDAPQICRTLRRDVRRYLDEIREARDKADRLRDDVPSHLRDAFDEGYGRDDGWATR